MVYMLYIYPHFIKSASIAICAKKPSTSNPNTWLSCCVSNWKVQRQLPGGFPCPIHLHLGPHHSRSSTDFFNPSFISKHVQRQISGRKNWCLTMFNCMRSQQMIQMSGKPSSIKLAEIYRSKPGRCTPWIWDLEGPMWLSHFGCNLTMGHLQGHHGSPRQGGRKRGLHGSPNGTRPEEPRRWNCWSTSPGEISGAEHRTKISRPNWPWAIGWFWMVLGELKLAQTNKILCEQHC